MMYICKKDGLKRDVHIYMPKLFIDGETVVGDRDQGACGVRASSTNYTVCGGCVLIFLKKS